MRINESRTIFPLLVVGVSLASSDSFIVIVSLGPNVLRVVKLMVRTMGSEIKVSVLAERTSRIFGDLAPIINP